ncbi:MAG: hypothetical protein JRI54_10385, partial [Deltaproteobacteria bacterium]|nr:hypothetical protein [Deltaproteobacteria bacterium]
MKSRILHIFNLFLCLSLIILGSCSPIWSADLEVRVKRVAYLPLHRPWIHVFVSVFTEEGRAVTGLDESRFLIEEDGRLFSGSKEVESFVASGRNLAYIIALDTRESLPTSLTLVSEGVKSLISEMGFRNPGAILVYTGRPEVLAGSTRNADLLMK